MSFFNKQAFLSELMDRTEIISSNTRTFLRLKGEQLSFKPTPKGWSICEIYSHLNIINEIYNDRILKKISSAPDVSIPHCQSGWFGDWIYEKLMPRSDGSVYKINTPKNYNASSEKLDAFEILSQFIEIQNVMHDILLHVSSKDIDRITISFYFSKLLRFRLSDTLRFIIAHNERHLMQAHGVLEKMPLVQNG
jgi:hypothetical protein